MKKTGGKGTKTVSIKLKLSICTVSSCVDRVVVKMSPVLSSYITAKNINQVVETAKNTY